MPNVHRELIRKLEKICKRKMLLCKIKGHPDSEIILSYDPKRVLPFVYLKCNNCGTIYARNATKEEERKYFSDLRIKLIMEIRKDNYKEE